MKLNHFNEVEFEHEIWALIYSALKLFSISEQKLNEEEKMGVTVVDSDTTETYAEVNNHSQNGSEGQEMVVEDDEWSQSDINDLQQLEVSLCVTLVFVKI